MADNTTIERTIYKLEIDGSAYVEGANNLSASTNKLSEAQEKANAKLIELQKNEINLKKSLEEVNAVIKANEIETLELTKKLNDLKNAGKGASDEAKKLQGDLRGLSTNTKEFRIEATTIKSQLTDTTKQLQLQQKQVESLSKSNVNLVGGFKSVYSGLRVIANIIPGIGIAGLISLVAGPLVDALSDWFDSLKDVNSQLTLMKANQDNVNEVMEEANKSAGKQIADLKILYETATNANIPIEDRRKAVVALQKEFPDYFKNLSQEAILNGEAKTSYDELAKSILATARATAAKSKIDALEAQQLDKDFERQKVINATNREFQRAQKAEATTIVIPGGGGLTPGGSNALEVTAEENQRIQKKAIQARKDARLAEIDEQKKLLQQQEDFLVQFAGQTNIAKVIEDKADKTGKNIKTSTKEVTNIYEQELQKLKADISKIDQNTFTDEASITKAVNDGFKIREQAFEKAFKDKQLTSQQLSSLKSYLKQLQDLTLNAQLESFRTQRQAFLKNINDEITSLQLEESTKRIQTFQNSFERERQTIISETDKSIEVLKQKRDKELVDIINNAKKVGLTQPEIASQVKTIEDAYSKLLDDLNTIKNQKLESLSFDVFEKLSEDAKRSLDAENLGISQGTVTRIKEESDLLQAGKISFEQYQKTLTEITKNEAQERYNVEVAFLKAEIKVRQDKLLTDKNLTDDQITRLQDEIRKLEQQLADAEKGNFLSQNTKEKKAKTDSLQSYATAVGKLAGSVVDFWKQANEAELQALDNSISIEEKRVDAAQRIADRGNAQYLKEETDKLNELNVARENAARKQLGIDAALQASQILVGITGAIAKIATPGIGVAETISEIAVIVGALATGYGLVRNLSANQPRLFKGTTFLERNGNPSGVDTIPAMLNEGEAVIPTDKNEEYHDTVKAVYHGSVPAEDINEFVKNYPNKSKQVSKDNSLTEFVTEHHNVKVIPQLNYEKIRETAELKISSDGKMSVALFEQNNLIRENTEYQKQILRVMKKMGVKVNMDKKGFAMSFLEAVEQIQRDKNA